MARRNGSTKFNARKAQGRVKGKGARVKVESRVDIDIESLKRDGYRVIGFEEEK